MLKNISNKERFLMIQEWIPTIIESIKKDLKNDHLKQDYVFVKKYLSNKNFQKASTEDLTNAYIKALQEEELADDIAEFMINRWLLKNTEIYNFFAQELQQINPDFTELEEIAHDASLDIIERANQQFGAPKTYLFSVLNSVVFSPEAFDQLAKRAENEKEEQRSQEESYKQQQSLESMQRNYDQQLARITDKYEKKLQGLQKKYLQDTESLKKQIAQLHKKISQ